MQSVLAAVECFLQRNACFRAELTLIADSYGSLHPAYRSS